MSHRIANCSYIYDIGIDTFAIVLAYLLLALVDLVGAAVRSMLCWWSGVRPCQFRPSWDWRLRWGCCDCVFVYARI